MLGHEIAHIQRHDWLVQIAAEAIRAIYWFNPVFWLACRRLRRESEQACDDAVLRLGVPPRDYAMHLLGVARSCRSSSLPVAAVMPMARPSTLERRIAAMLNPSLGRRALSRWAVAVTVVGLLGVALPTAAFRVAQAGPLALSGVIYDPSGGVLPEAALCHSRTSGRTSGRRPATRPAVSNSRRSEPASTSWRCRWPDSARCVRSSN